MSTPQSVCITVRGCWAMQAASQGLPGNNTAAHTLRNGHSRGPTTPGSQQQQSPGGPLPDSSVLGVHLGWGSTLAPAERSASGSLGPLPPGLPPTSAIARASSQSLYNSPFGSGFGSAGGASRPPSGRLPDNLGFGVVGAPRSVGLPSGPHHCHRRSMDMLGRQARGRPPQIIPVQLEPAHVQIFEVASRFENFCWCCVMLQWAIVVTPSCCCHCAKASAFEIVSVGHNLPCRQSHHSKVRPSLAVRRTQGTSRMSPQQEAAGAAWSPAMGSAARLQAAASGALGLGHLQGLPLDTARSGGLLMERAASAGTRHCPPGFPAMVPLVDCFTERVSCWCTLTILCAQRVLESIGADIFCVAGALSRKPSLREVQVSKLLDLTCGAASWGMPVYMVYLIACSQDPASHSWRETTVHWALQ